MSNRTDWGLDLEGQIRFRAWPDMSRGSHLLDVAQIAERCTEETLQPQSIAAVLLWQQLAEQLLLMVEYWCYYEKALAIFPTRINYSEPERMMFGQLLKRITEHQEFPRKVELLKSCAALNSECRIPIAHRLADPKVFAALAEAARNARKHFSEIRMLFMEIQMYFMHRFNQLAERTGIPSANALGSYE